MSNAIRIETAGATDLTLAHDWLARHRGQTLELEHTGQLEFGVPITAARAVLVAVTLQGGDADAPRIGGVVRAIAGRADTDPVRLVFEGRSPAHLPSDQAESEAARMLSAISGLMAEDEASALVA